MKKVFTLLVLTFISFSSMATDYVAYQPSTLEAVYWSSEESNHQPEIKIPMLAAGDVIKIRVSNVAEDFSYNVIWRGKVSGDWKWFTLFSGTTCANGEISYTVGASDNASAEEVAASIVERGIVLTGNFKLLDVTFQSSLVASDGSYRYRTLFSGSKSLGEEGGTGGDAAWTPYVDLRYYDYSRVREGDIMQIEYTVTENKEGQIQLQKNWNKYGTDDTTDKGNLSGSSTIDFEITSAMLSIMQETGDGRNDNFVLKGKNTTITGISLISTAAKAGYRPVYISSAGYATYYGESTCALPEGVEAYYVSNTNINTETHSGTATLTQINNIPANQGVLLKGSEGIYQLHTTTEAAATVTGNLLAGSTTRGATSVTDASRYYKLSYDSEGNDLGWYWGAEGGAAFTIDAYKAYMGLTTAQAGAISRFLFEEDVNNTTDVKDIENSDKAVKFWRDGQLLIRRADGIYDILGRVVEK